jgi:hypothetical protein
MAAGARRPGSLTMPAARADIGTSGWNYSHWRNTVYPPGLKQSEWLHYLSRQMDTLEVNYSFYRISTIGSCHEGFTGDLRPRL